MPRVSDPDLLVLLTLRLRTLADLDAIAAATDQPGPSALGRLSALEERGWVRHRDGRVQGWMLTPDGREACATMLAAELDAATARADVSRAYQRFLAVNQPLLDLCTDWQLRGDESAEATARLATGLDQVDAVGQTVCRELSSVLARFDGYAPRLAAARASIASGDPDWLTGPTIDSYHTVWFELHENLLATLGLERGQEAAHPAPAPTATSLQEAR